MISVELTFKSTAQAEVEIVFGVGARVSEGGHCNALVASKAVELGLISGLSRRDLRPCTLFERVYGAPRQLGQLQVLVSALQARQLGLVRRRCWPYGAQRAQGGGETTCGGSVSRSGRAAIDG